MIRCDLGISTRMLVFEKSVTWADVVAQHVRLAPKWVPAQAAVVPLLAGFPANAPRKTIKAVQVLKAQASIEESQMEFGALGFSLAIGIATHCAYLKNETVNGITFSL